MNRWLSFVFVLIVWACIPAIEKRQKAIDKFYDISGLIDEQVILLESVSPSLLKKATIDGKEEIIEITPLDSAWEKELVIFKSADINRPLLVDSYDVQEAEDGTSIIYISKFPKSTTVDTLSIFLDTEKKPKKIRAFIQDRNALFSTNKKLELIFGDYNDLPALTNYSIVGWQKMTSKDSTHISIQAGIAYP